MEQAFDIKTVATLTKTLSQIMDKPDAKLHEYKGIPFEASVKEDTLVNVMPNWKAREDDVFIVTYPKADWFDTPKTIVKGSMDAVFHGTTWAQEIMYLAIHGGDVDKAKKIHSSFRTPYLEFTQPAPFEQKVNWFAHPFKSLLYLWCAMKILFGLLLFSIKQGRFSIPTKFDLIDMMSSPRLIKSHFPEHMLPPDIYSEKAKIVCVLRNPKDLAVSFYYFSQWIPGIPTPHSWDAFFEDFMKGNVIYGKWYEHYLGFWKRRDDDNILILKYEDMKKDEKAAVTQICEFLGYHYSDDIIDRIVQHTTFGSMKANSMSNIDIVIPKEKDVPFMRKGVVGDWKNYFSEAQDQAIMAVYQDKFTGTGLTFEFE